MSEFPHVDVKSLKVAELKDELTKRGLDTKGLKKDLADRLQAFQDTTESDSAQQFTSKDNEAKEGTEDGVGRTMLDGYPEDPNTQHHKTPSPPPKDVVDTEPAVLDDEVAKIVAEEEAKDLKSPTPSPPRRLSPLPVSNLEKEEEVGRVMVDGYPENPDTTHHKTPTPPPKEILDTEPAALDGEVAQVVAEEEAKDLKSPTPSPPRRLSPLPKDDAQDDGDEDMQIDDEDDDQEVTGRGVESNNQGESSKKRARSISPSSVTDGTNSNKKTKLTLPSSLSHIKQPPTSVLYVTNLKRPLLHSTLHSYLTPSASNLAELPPSKMPFSQEDYSGLWLSGVKSHAYATYPSIEEAINIAEKIENKRWPEDTGDILKIQFIPEHKLLELVEQEEAAWLNGRQKLTLKITGPENEDGEWLYELIGAGGLGRLPPPPRSGPSRENPVVSSGSNSRPIAVRPLTGGDRRSGPRAVPLTGVNAINPGKDGLSLANARGQGISIGIRGRSNQTMNHYSQQPSRPIPDQPRSEYRDRGDGRKYDRDRDIMRNGTGEGLRGWSDERDKSKKEKEILKMRPTRFQPRLFWKKGPGALDRI